MKHTKDATIKSAFQRYLKSDLYTLRDCYLNPSEYKEDVFQYCLQLYHENNGRQLRIIGYNTTSFSVGFIGEIPHPKTGAIEPAFFYITKDYDRYIMIDELEG